MPIGTNAKGLIEPGNFEQRQAQIDAENAQRYGIQSELSGQTLENTGNLGYEHLAKGPEQKFLANWQK